MKISWWKRIKLFFLYRKADGDEAELLSISQGIESSLNNASPLGAVAAKDLGLFFEGVSSEQERGMTLQQMKWRSDSADAQRLAIEKWQEWRRDN